MESPGRLDSGQNPHLLIVPWKRPACKGSCAGRRLAGSLVPAQAKLPQGRRA
jgi:hypothetical protein